MPSTGDVGALLQPAAQFRRVAARAAVITTSGDLPDYRFWSTIQTANAFHQAEMPAMRAIARLILVATSVGLVGAALAAQPTPPAANRVISAAVRGPLHAAQQAQRAGNVDLEIQALLKAQAASRKTEYDHYLINSLLATAYVNKREPAKAVPLLIAAAQSPYASPAQRKGFTEAAVGFLNSPPGRSPR